MNRSPQATLPEGDAGPVIAPPPPDIAAKSNHMKKHLVTTAIAVPAPSTSSARQKNKNYGVLIPKVLERRSKWRSALWQSNRFAPQFPEQFYGC